MRKLSKTRAWMVLTAQVVLITPLVAGLAFITAPFLTSDGDQQQGSWQHSSSSLKFSVLGSNPANTPIQVKSTTGAFQTRLAVSQVTRTGEVCQTMHEVKNISDGPVQRVSLLFDLVSKSGAALGSVAVASGIIDLDPGEQRAIAFEFKCQRSLGEATARLPKQGTGSPEIALIHASGQSRPSVAAPGFSEQFSKIVVPIDDVYLCRFPDPCTLDVRVNADATIQVKFRRDSKYQEALVSNNQILIAHLAARKKASIEQVHGDKAILIPLDRQMLTYTEQPGYFARIWSWLFDTRGHHV